MGGKAREIGVDVKRCKGCGICIEFCPADVLELIDGKSVVVALDRCTACNLCDLRCPDFAITVFPVDDEEYEETA